MKNHIDLNRAIIRGEAGRKVLWQPRIICWYDDRKFNNTDRKSTRLNSSH